MVAGESANRWVGGIDTIGGGPTIDGLVVAMDNLRMFVSGLHAAGQEGAWHLQRNGCYLVVVRSANKTFGSRGEP